MLSTTLACDPWVAKLRQAAIAGETRHRAEYARQLALRPTCRALVALVAEFYGLRVDEITGPGRRRLLIEARRMACFLCKRVVDASTTQIGRALKRDHSTVCYHLAQATGPSFNWSDFATIEQIVYRLRKSGSTDHDEHAGS